MSTRQIKVDPSKPPSFDLFCAWTKANGFTDDEFNRAWWNEMENISYWRAKKTGDPIHHWPALFNHCYKQAHKVTRRETRQEEAERKVAEKRKAALDAAIAKLREDAKRDPTLWQKCREDGCANAPAEGECGCKVRCWRPPNIHPDYHQEISPKECRFYQEGGVR